jgi:hypothetical protein
MNASVLLGYMCMYVCVCVCTYIHTYTHTHTIINLYHITQRDRWKTKLLFEAAKCAGAKNTDWGKTFLCMPMHINMLFFLHINQRNCMCFIAYANTCIQNSIQVVHLMYVCVRGCKHVHVHVHVHVRALYLCAYVYVYIYIYMLVCLYFCVCICLYKNRYVCTYTYIHIYICMYEHIYI